MNKRKILLRLAAFLVLFTCAGHTFGTFAPIPDHQTEMKRTVEIMKQTMIPMPMGTPKSYIQVLDGNNFSVSLYLLVTGLVFVLLSNASPAGADQSTLLVTSAGMLLLSVISAFYFFPLPAICTGLAGILGLAARSQGGS